MKPTSTKTLFILSVVLSLILIGITVIYIVNLGGESGTNNKIYLLLFIILALALSTIILAHVVSKRRVKKISILADGYREKYEKITLLISSANISPLDKKQVDEDLLGLFFDAQTSGRDLDNLIGTDEKVFADRVIAAHGGKKNIFLYLLTGLQYFLVYLLVIKGFDILTGKMDIEDYLTATVANSAILFFAIASFVIIPLVFFTYKQALIKNKQLLILLGLIVYPLVIIGLFVLLMEVLEKSFTHIPWVNSLIFGETVIFDSYWLGTVIIGLTIAVFYAKRLMRKYYLKKELT